MTTPDPPPTRNDNRTKSLGKWLTGSGALNFVLMIVALALAFTVMQQANVISALSDGVTQQRDQFEACKDKPATTRGCATPVAAQPEVIIKQGKQGVPGLPGADGAMGPRGPMGPAGKDGPPGPMGPQGVQGKQGPPPGCMLLSTGCIGATGADGQDGKDGPPGPAGKDGADGKPGADGKDGAEGKKGDTGRGLLDQFCPADDNDPTTDQAWVLIWNEEPLQTSAGVCRPRTAP